MQPILLNLAAAGADLVLAAALVFPDLRLRGLLPKAPTMPWLRLTLAGAGLLIGAVMLASIRSPFLAFFAATATVLFSAAVWGLSATSGAPAPLLPGLALASALAVAVLQPLGLKVLALPRAAKLPYQPVPATLIKTYPKGVGFESVRAGPDGALYLAANKGLDFTRSDYFSEVEGQVIVRRPDRVERVLFTLPRGAAAGVFAVTDDGVLYMASNSRNPGVWRIGPDGQGRQLTRLPAGAWPNGLDFGPDGQLYAADSARGLIWRIDPKSGHAEAVLQDRRLLARPFISLAPGANGLHFSSRDLYVTVSDRTEVLKYHLNDDGRFGLPTVVAEGIPGDDFAIGPDGSLFITTHPYNTVVRVAPDGSRMVVADPRQHIVGATDATFGRGPHDRDVLYVATDGGAFQNGASSRGALVALRPYADADARLSSRP